MRSTVDCRSLRRMDIDTETIRRLRDQLLAADTPPDTRVVHGDANAAVKAAVARRIEPFAETMYLVMMADGQSAVVERDALVAALKVLSDDQLGDADILPMLERFAQLTDGVGTEGRLAQLGAHLSADRDDRETAFALAAVIALADESVAVQENRVLEWVSEYYGISQKRMASILGAIG